MASSQSDHVLFKTQGSHLVARILDTHIVTAQVARGICASLTSALNHQGSNIRAVRIDLTQVEMIGSAGLNELIGFRTRACGQGLDVRLSDAQPQVYKVLLLTRLDRVFDVPEIPLPLAQ